MCGRAANTQTLDLEVRGSSLARRVVSLDKELYSTMSLFTQVYKWVPATYCWGNPVRDGLAFRPGGSSNTRRYASCYGNRYKLRPCGPLALPTFTSLKQVQSLELHLVHPPPHQHLHSIHTSVSVITGRTLTIVAKVTT